MKRLLRCVLVLMAPRAYRLVPPAARQVKHVVKSVSDRPDGDMENTHCLKMVRWEAGLGLPGHPFVYAFFLTRSWT